MCVLQITFILQSDLNPSPVIWLLLVLSGERAREEFSKSQLLTQVIWHINLRLTPSCAQTIAQTLVTFITYSNHSSKTSLLWLLPHTIIYNSRLDKSEENLSFLIQWNASSYKRSSILCWSCSICRFNIRGFFRACDVLQLPPPAAEQLRQESGLNSFSDNRECLCTMFAIVGFIHSFIYLFKYSSKSR